MEMIKRQKQLRKEISLIPLINIIFLLLIFFMIAGQVQRLETLDVEEPVASEGKERRYLPVILYMDADGKIALNGDVIKREDLRLLLRVSLENLKYDIQAVTIKADKNSMAKQLVWLMDEVKKAGGREVSIIVNNGNNS